MTNDLKDDGKAMAAAVIMVLIAVATVVLLVLELVDWWLR